MSKNKNEGFAAGVIGAILTVFALLLINSILGAVTTAAEINYTCDDNEQAYFGYSEVFRIRGENFCYIVWPDKYGRPAPKYIGEVNCVSKTFFWENKNCYLVEDKSK